MTSMISEISPWLTSFKAKPPRTLFCSSCLAASSLSAKTIASFFNFSFRAVSKTCRHSAAITDVSGSMSISSLMDRTCSALAHGLPSFILVSVRLSSLPSTTTQAALNSPPAMGTNRAVLAAVVPTRPKYREPRPTTLAPLATAPVPMATSALAAAAAAPPADATSVATMPPATAFLRAPTPALVVATPCFSSNSLISLLRASRWVSVSTPSSPSWPSAYPSTE
mmetsp:Transcript_4622/g.11643  ORF Transcript_4622/g.11643 Transcript_4622/m.11643 type:complete len:224 (+) Transcript_4622:182-853(+)